MLNGISNVSLQNINVYGQGAICALTPSSTCGVGILAEKNGSTLANVINIASSNFYYLSNGIDGVGDVESLTVQQSTFLGNSIGILASSSPAAPALQWNIGPNNNFTDVFQDIKITNPVYGLTVNNNFLMIANASEVGIDIAAPGATNGPVIVQGNYIDCTNPSNTEGIYIGASQATGPHFPYPSVVNGNLITGCGWGILPDLNSTLINIESNAFSGNTNAIANYGTLNVIANNLGYNPVGTGAALYVPLSGATYTAGASPETHYLTGGTVTAAQIPDSSGATICTATPCFVSLGPNETMSVTYTAKPVDTVSIH